MAMATSNSEARKKRLAANEIGLKAALAGFNDQLDDLHLELQKTELKRLDERER